MTKTPIHVIIAGMRRKSLPEQIHELQEWLKQEPLRSTRHNEIYSLLRGKVSKQLRKEMAA